MMQPKHTKRTVVPWMAAAFLLCSLQVGCIYVSGRGLLGTGPRPLEETRVSGKGKDKILVIDVKGLITEEERGGLLSLTKEPGMVASIQEQLDKAAKDDRVRAVLLLVDSPGGTVTASDLIYHELRTFRADRKVVMHAHFLGTAASGAYLIAQAADRITATPTTVTGSIGVILMNLNLSGLMEKVGVSDTSLKSGTFKDVGSPFRKPRPADDELLQGIVDSEYRLFCRIVEENRPKVRLSEHPELADGRIFTADQALRAGLVDEVGYLSQSLDGIKKALGVEEARVVRYVPAGSYVPNLYALGAAASGGPGDINLIKLDVRSLVAAGGPVFMYLWLPGI
jgi:protease IV